MKVLHEGIEYILAPESIAREDGGCSLTLSSEGGDSIVIELPELVCDYEKAMAFDYGVHLFQSRHLVVDRFSEVFIKKKGRDKQKGGYVFPLESIVNSDSYLYSSDTESYTYGYAFGAVWHLLSNSSGQVELKSINWGGRYRLLEFYNNDLVLLSLDQKRVESYFRESYIECFIPKLASLRVFEWRENVSPREKYAEEGYFFEEKITFYPVSSHVSPDVISFIRNKVAQSDCEDKDPLVRFFLQYQVIEMLMSEVFDSVMSGFLSKVSLSEYKKSSWKTKKLVSKLSDKSSEKNRIKKAFSAFGNQDELMSNLMESCREFFNGTPKLGSDLDFDPTSTDADVAEAVYAVRNVVFHGYASYKINNEDLKDVCDAMSNLLFSVIYSHGEYSESFGS